MVCLTLVLVSLSLSVSVVRMRRKAAYESCTYFYNIQQCNLEIDKLSLVGSMYIAGRPTVTAGASTVTYVKCPIGAMHYG